MKSKTILFFIVAMVCGASAQTTLPKVDGVPRFIGYLAIGDDKWFALAMPAADGKSESKMWLKIGQPIGKLKIASFDIKKETLVLRKSDGRDIEVKLVEGKVLDGDDSEALVKSFLEKLATTSIRDLPPQIGRY